MANWPPGVRHARDRVADSDASPAGIDPELFMIGISASPNFWNCSIESHTSKTETALGNCSERATHSRCKKLQAIVITIEFVLMAEHPLFAHAGERGFGDDAP